MICVVEEPQAQKPLLQTAGSPSEQIVCGLSHSQSQVPVVASQVHV